MAISTSHGILQSFAKELDFTGKSQEQIKTLQKTRIICKLPKCSACTRSAMFSLTRGIEGELQSLHLSISTVPIHSRSS